MTRSEAFGVTVVLTVASLLVGCLQPPVPDDDEVAAPSPTLPTSFKVLPDGAKVSLTQDAAVFWRAPPLRDVQNPACLVYGAPSKPTLRYEVEVSPGNKEFRVAVEKVFTETCMRFELVDPTGVSRRAPAREAAGEGT